MNLKEWAFIDFENIGSLKNVSIDNYAVIYIFIGAKQSFVTLEPQITDQIIQVNIIKIKETSKDNLDFHLSYYLGKLDASAKKDISFTVISNDTGFDHLIKHISVNGRKCKRVKSDIASDPVTVKMLKELLNKDVTKLPKTKDSLKNYINSHLRNDNSKQMIDMVYQTALKQKKISDRIKQSG